MPGDDPVIRDFIYLDYERVKSLAAQLGVSEHRAAASAADPDQPERERMSLALEAAVMARGGAAEVDPSFDFASWTPGSFSDGQFVVARGAVRLLDFSWLAMALTGLPAVLKKMSKIEMAALRNSDEGRRLSKQALQQRGQENMAAIAKVEELRMDELSDVVSQLYPGMVRVKVRPSPDHPRHVLIGSAYAQHFYDSPAAFEIGRHGRGAVADNRQVAVRAHRHHAGGAGGPLGRARRVLRSAGENNGGEQLLAGAIAAEVDLLWLDREACVAAWRSAGLHRGRPHRHQGEGQNPKTRQARNYHDRPQCRRIS